MLFSAEGGKLDDNFYSSSFTFWGREEISIHFVLVPFLSSHVVFGAEKGERGRGNTEIDVLNIIFLRRRILLLSAKKILGQLLTLPPPATKTL